MSGEDTNRTSVQDMTLDLLKDIRDDLSGMKTEQARQRKQLEQLTLDVNIIHKFQQSFTERLSIVEKFCVEQPLRSSTSGNGGQTSKRP